MDFPLVPNFACRERRHELRLLYAILFTSSSIASHLYALFPDFCGTIIGAPVIPVILIVTWRKVNRAGVMIGSMGGSVLAIIAWIITCRFYYGAVNVTNLVSNYSSLAGNLVSLWLGGLLCVVITLIKPDDYDFKGTKNSKHFLQH